MAGDPRWYVATKKEIHEFFGVSPDTVQTWGKWLGECEVQHDGKKHWDLSKVQEIRYNRLRDAPQSRRVRHDGGVAISYADKKDREQAWKLRYERLETQEKYVSKKYVQDSIRRWALSFPGPLKEFVALVVSMAPGNQKAQVKEQGLAAVAQCMQKVKDLATAYGAEINVEEIQKRRKAKIE